jgi:hypothetical protein
MIRPEFRATVEGIALPFRELNDELMAEKRTPVLDANGRKNELSASLRTFPHYRATSKALRGVKWTDRHR